MERNQAMPPRRRRKNRPAIRKAPFIVILIFMIIGIIGIAVGEPRRVLGQAIQICFSCIGIS